MASDGMDGPTDDARRQFARAAVFARRTLRSWRVVVLFVMIGAALFGVFLLVRKPTFRSETVLLHSEGVRMTDDTERPDPTRSVTLRLKEILFSRAGLEGIIREFDLYPDVRRSLGPVDAVEELRRHVEFRAPGGDTFSIAFTGSSPEQAAGVTRRLAELVVSGDADLRQKQAVVTRDFLDAEEKRTEQELRAREEELAAFIAAHPRFAFDVAPSANGAAVRATLSPVGPATATPSLSALRTPGVPSSSQGAPASAPRSAGHDEASAEVARAGAAVAAAKANLADLMAHFTPAHPDVRAANAVLSREMERLAAATAAASATAPRAPVEVPPVEPSPVVQPAASPRSTPPPPPTTKTPSSEREVAALETDWAKLTRGVTEARQHQDQVEAALFKASLLASSESGGHGAQITVIDPAFVPRTPVPPGRTAIAGMFLAASLFVGIIGALLRTLLSDRIHDAEDVRSLALVLAEIPIQEGPCPQSKPAA